MSNNHPIAIKLSHVTKQYTIHHEKPTLMEKLVNGKDEEFWALRDIKLTIKKKRGVGRVTTISYDCPSNNMINGIKTVLNPIPIYYRY